MMLLESARDSMSFGNLLEYLVPCTPAPRERLVLCKLPYRQLGVILHALHVEVCHVLGNPQRRGLKLNPSHVDNNCVMYLESRSAGG